MRLVKLVVLINLAFLLTASNFAEGATWYVRSDGGDDSECTGQADEAYDGAGTGEACAYEHPFWVFGVHANCDVSVGRKYSAGDTIILEDESFMMGYGAPNTAGGASAFPWDCHILPILGGADSNNRTKIYGRNYASCSSISSATELYAVERSEAVIWTDGSSDHVEFKCLNITDHDNCRYGGSGTYPLSDGNGCTVSAYPYGDYGYKGVESTGTSDAIWENIWVHGMGSEGWSVDTPTDWTLTNVNVWGNSGINFNFNGTGTSVPATTDQATGTMTFTGGIVAWGGCVEEYPPTLTDYDGISTYAPKSCCSQDQNAICISDGLGSQSNEATWIFDNVSYIRNVADGLDLLYHDVDGGSGYVEVKNSKFFKNSGNQLKVGGNARVFNVTVDAECNYFSGKSFTYTGDGGFGDHCRAAGNAISLAYQTNTDIYLEGLTVVNTENAEPISITARNIANCASNNLLVIKNGIFTTTNGLGWMNVDASCSSATVTQTNSYIYGFTTNPSGTGNTFTDPGLTGTIFGSDQDFLLPSADNGADESTTYQTSTDIFDYDRGASWDRGAIEYGSTDTGWSGGGGGGSGSSGISFGGARWTLGGGKIIKQ